MCFTPLTRKLVYTFIFPTNHFRTDTQREREREKRSLTHTLAPPSSSHRGTPSNHFKKISLLTHSHHSRQAQAEGRRELSPMKPRSSPWPTAPPVWSRRSNLSSIWSRRLKPIFDEPSLIVLAFAFASTLWSRL